MTRPAWLLAAALLAGCGHATPLLLTGVPDTESLLTYQLPADSAGLRTVLLKALDETICLVRSGGRADECREALDTPGCDPRSAAEVRARYAPAFDSIPAVVMSDAEAMNHQLRGLFPGGSPDIPIQDARRAKPCRDWNDDGSCAAIQYHDVWLLFRGPDDSRRRPATLEIFLAHLPCRGDIG